MSVFNVANDNIKFYRNFDSVECGHDPLNTVGIFSLQNLVTSGQRHALAILEILISGMDCVIELLTFQAKGLYRS